MAVPIKKTTHTKFCQSCKPRAHKKKAIGYSSKAGLHVVLCLHIPQEYGSARQHEYANGSACCDLPKAYISTFFSLR